MLGSVQVGVKRKLDDSSLFEKSYHDQRQSILNISMCKLKTFPKRRVEPSLLHSVLIFNTLRCIEHELQEEGVSMNPAATPAFLPSIQSQDTVNLDSLPGADSASHNLELHNTKLESKGAQSVSNLTHSCQTVSVTPTPMDTANSAETVTPVSLKTNDQVSSVPRAMPKEHSSTVMKNTNVDVNSNLSSCESMNTTLTEFSKLLVTSQWTSAQFNSNSGASAASNVFTPSAMSTASNFFGSNSNRWDDFFSDADLDLSVYDFDLFSPISTNSKLAPLSAEELLHTFPSPTDPLVPFTNAGGSCKNDVLSEDLDHIMQVLVGI